MQARFLLGQAGCGKTHRCLAEIRAELVACPDGLPLVLLAPKQATFQLERQLLSTGELAGYSRLRILSFERLADFVVKSLRFRIPDQLTDEGRLMVLRALLARHADQLKLFRASARLPGFAQQLNLVLRELQHHQLLPQRLEVLATKAQAGGTLGSKLRDLALLLRAYLDWLDANQLQDSDVLLSVAAEALQNQSSDFHLDGLWLDGFAEMTPQEVDLLSAVLPHCDQATLAFCLERKPQEELPWLSTWSVVSQTFRECYASVSAIPETELRVAVLNRDAAHSRFAEEPALAHLEANWSSAQPFEPWARGSRADQQTALHSDRPEAGQDQPSACGDYAGSRADATGGAALFPIRLLACRDPEGEAIAAAHEILHYVREEHGRFRDCAVLLRTIEGCHDVFRRVFSRYEIPFFLDRRESISHHPLAELVRFSLRLAAFRWQCEDWFGVLKTGLVHAREEQVDRLENVALEYGWEGDVWRHPLKTASNPEIGDWAEPLRVALVPPFVALEDRVRGEVDGRELATALRELWQTLAVEHTLEHWSRELPDRHDGSPAVHDTVWEQMQLWLENLELAFPTQAMRVTEWLPILEAGLANLTVGVIPPALDQVLIGTVDRSRNPELQLVILPGFNESVFPAPLPAAGLLTESDREVLEGWGARLGPGRLRRLGHERYYGYIACTRARHRLVVSYAQRDADDRELHPSVFVGHLKRLFRGLGEESLDKPAPPWVQAMHTSELIAPLLRQAQMRHARREGTGSFDHSLVAEATSGHVSPHPDPLPKGEGESTAAPKLARANSDSSEVHPAIPSPWGEGQGEGKEGIGSPGTLAQEGAENLRLTSLLELPGLEQLRELMERLPHYSITESLSPALAGALYLKTEDATRVFRSSVSRLETFAACPFRFFVEAGLRAEERLLFEVDRRERGTLQHAVLERFHHEIANSGRRWRDISPEDAAALIGRLVDEIAADYREGLFLDDEHNQFTTAALKASLQRFIRAVIGWMKSYQLDPVLVEVAFGLDDSSWPAWRIPLGQGRELALRGKVDRVDLSMAAGDTPWCVVMDYKSGTRKLESLKLLNGLQLQLPAYLAALESFAQTGLIEKCSAIRPAGMFYANLRGATTSGQSRQEVLNEGDAELATTFRHFGRFNADALAWLDANATSAPSGQFNFALNKNGSLSRQYADPLDGASFTALLRQVREKLAEFGNRILGGEAAVDPYRHNSAKACDQCELGAVCRIEPRTHRFRTLEVPARSAK